MDDDGNSNRAIIFKLPEKDARGVYYYLGNCTSARGDNFT
jgi:hypothetical protein